MKSLQAKLQGLWVGAALGELYARTQLCLPTDPNEWVASRILPTVYTMGTVAEQALKTVGDCPTKLLLPNRDGLPNPVLVLDNVLALAFADSRGPQGLMEIFRHAQRTADPIAPFPQAIAILQTLDWFHHRPPTPALLHALQQSPSLQNTLLGKRLDALEQVLQTHQLLPGLRPLVPPSLDEIMLQMLFCLISTPSDFALIVQRTAQRLANHPDAVTLVAGLAGFAQGLGQLPLQWRFTLQSMGWSVATPLEEQLLTFATGCGAQWAGCYRPRWLRDGSIIAPPGQLRPR